LSKTIYTLSKHRWCASLIWMLFQSTLSKTIYTLSKHRWCASLLWMQFQSTLSKIISIYTLSKDRWCASLLWMLFQAARPTLSKTIYTLSKHWWCVSLLWMQFQSTLSTTISTLSKHRWCASLFWMPFQEAIARSTLSKTIYICDSQSGGETHLSFILLVDWTRDWTVGLDCGTGLRESCTHHFGEHRKYTASTYQVCECVIQLSYQICAWLCSIIHDPMLTSDERMALIIASKHVASWAISVLLLKLIWAMQLFCWLYMDSRPRPIIPSQSGNNTNINVHVGFSHWGVLTAQDQCIGVHVYSTGIG